MKRESEIESRPRDATGGAPVWNSVFGIPGLARLLQPLLVDGKTSWKEVRAVKLAAPVAVDCQRSNHPMKRIVFAFVLLPALASAQDAAEVRKLFEAGRHQQVVEAASPNAAPDVVYTAAQSLQKLGATDQARELYAQLAGRPDGDVWHFIGLSGGQLLGDDATAALASARRAVQMDGGLPEAQYQLGLVLAKRQAWAEAAAAFDSAANANPANAYAHYYSGLMHYRANRPDRMANRFEQFLKLAPEAPERPEVLQIMRTVRGR
jgi:tetratricopeptide (TPR) repeat protein